MKKRYTKIKRATVLILCTILAFAPVCTETKAALSGSSSKTASDSGVTDKLKEQEEKVGALEDEKAKADQQVDALEDQKTGLESKLSGLNQNLTELSNSIEELAVQITDKEQEIEDTKTALEEAREKADQQYEDMKLRIQFMYENGSDSLVISLLQASSITDFLNKAEYVRQISEYDRNMLISYNETIEEVTEKEAALEEQQEELLALQEETADKKDQVTAMIDNTQKDITDSTAQLVNAQGVSEELAEQLEQEKTYELQLEQQKANEDAARQAEIAAQEAELAALNAAAAEKAAADKAAAEAAANAAAATEQTGTEDGQTEDPQDGQTGEQASENDGTADSGEQTTGNTGFDATDSDYVLLAALIYCEAGGEPYEGQVAVGSVVMNRVRSSYFPNTISGVIYQSNQFSPVASGRLATVLANGLTTDSCRQAASQVIAGNLTNSFLYFRSNNVTFSFPVTVIGNQAFY